MSDEKIIWLVAGTATLLVSLYILNERVKARQNAAGNTGFLSFLNGGANTPQAADYFNSNLYDQSPAY